MAQLHPSSRVRPARPRGIYGLGSPDGIKIGEHGTGPEVHPDTRDFEADPMATDRLRKYAAEWLPGVDPASGSPADLPVHHNARQQLRHRQVGPHHRRRRLLRSRIQVHSSDRRIGGRAGRGKHFGARNCFPFRGSGTAWPQLDQPDKCEPICPKSSNISWSDMSTIVTIAGSPSSSSSSDALLSHVVRRDPAGRTHGVARWSSASCRRQPCWPRT